MINLSPSCYYCQRILSQQQKRDENRSHTVEKHNSLMERGRCSGPHSLRLLPISALSASMSLTKKKNPLDLTFFIFNVLEALFHNDHFGSLSSYESL